jgi:hypothetical protein
MGRREEGGVISLTLAGKLETKTHSKYMSVRAPTHFQTQLSSSHAMWQQCKLSGTWFAWNPICLLLELMGFSDTQQNPRLLQYTLILLWTFHSFSPPILYSCIVSYYITNRVFLKVTLSSPSLWASSHPLSPVWVTVRIVMKFYKIWVWNAEAQHLMHKVPE